MSVAGERMKQRRLSVGRKPRFTIEFPGDSDKRREIIDRLQEMKNNLGCNEYSASNLDAFEF